jgi:hypothetical protein
VPCQPDQHARHCRPALGNGFKSLTICKVNAKNVIEVAVVEELRCIHRLSILILVEVQKTPATDEKSTVSGVLSATHQPYS